MHANQNQYVKICDCTVTMAVPIRIALYCQGQLQDGVCKTVVLYCASSISQPFPEAVLEQQLWESHWGISDDADPFFSCISYLIVSDAENLDTLLEAFTSLFKLFASKIGAGTTNTKHIFWGVLSFDKQIPVALPGLMTLVRQSDHATVRVTSANVRIGDWSISLAGKTPTYAVWDGAGQVIFIKGGLDLKGPRGIYVTGLSGVNAEVRFTENYPGTLAFTTTDIPLTEPGLQWLKPFFRYVWRERETSHISPMLFALWDGFSFVAPGSGLRLQCIINPLVPDTAEATHFLFSQSDGQALSLVSNFPCRSGGMTKLNVIDGISGVAWSRVRGDANFLFVPYGEYEVAGEEGKSVDILCGLLGEEYVSLPANGRIVFHPGCPARITPSEKYSGSVGSGTCLTGAEFTREDTTSYVSFRCGDGSGVTPEYVSTPLDGAWYAGCEGSAVFTPLRMAFPLDAAGNAPLIPYAGWNGRDSAVGEKLITMEKTAIYQKRFSIFHALAPDNTNLAVPLSGSTFINPQGLFFSVSDEGQPRIQVLVSGSNAEHKLFLNVDGSPAFRPALAKGDAFIVFGVEHLMGELAATDDMVVTFDGTSTTGPGLGCIGILKLCRGKTTDWLVRPCDWACGQELNTDRFGGLTVWINDYLDTASMTDNSDYSPLLHILEDETWTGFLLLNIPLGSALPEVFKPFTSSLAASGGACLHHVFSSSAGTVTADGIVSFRGVSGLIDYHDADYEAACLRDPANADNPVLFLQASPQMRTLRLNARIEDSHIVNASYRLQVKIDELFGSAVHDVISSDGDVLNWYEFCLMLNGGEQLEGDVATSFLSLVRPVRYRLACQALKAVEVTMVRRGGTGDGGLELSLGGQLDFSLIDGYDILSFGSECGDGKDFGKGLHFENLVLRQERRDLSGNEVMVMAADYSGLTIRMGNVADGGAPRSNGLFRVFPATPKRLVSGKAGEENCMPAGHLGVDTGRWFSEMGNSDWLGLESGLIMGATGALGGDQPIPAVMTIAWDPSAHAEGPPGIALWLRIGGANGRSLPALQNFFQLSFGDVSLLPDEKTGAFVLTFSNAGLKLFNKTFPSGSSLSLRLSIRPADASFDPDFRALGWIGSLVKK